PQLVQAVSAFMFPVESRQKLALEIMQKVELSKSIMQFVNLLIAKNRFQVLEQIHDAFRGLVDRSKNTVRGTLTTVDVLNEAETNEISQAFARKFNKQVVLEPVIDKSLLGGLVVQVQGLTFDGSLKTTIRRLRETLERQSI
ncbi:MAG: ATP synthase F1 subunit delta, partial [Deltaproteobacteria bacterium]|nr:ATP synthase F1 subunit delta [Deltaproteobacteria bacterium]